MRSSKAMTLGLFLLIPTASVAEPTLQQTVNYINDAYKACSPVMHRERRSVGRGTYTRMTVYDKTTISVKNNRIIMRESIRYVSALHGQISDSFYRGVCLKGHDNLPMWARRYGSAPDRCAIGADKYTFTASALASNLSVEVDLKKQRLVIQCIAGKQCFKAVRKGRGISWKGEGNKIDERTYNSHSLLPTCENRRGKLRRAFSHLIKIMGGKKDLF